MKMLHHLIVARETIIQSQSQPQECTQRMYICSYEVSSNFPASQLLLKTYSLQADMVNGWRPRTKVIGPIPFNFDFPVVDQIIDELTSFGGKHRERVIYLGRRYQSSFKVHQEMAHRYRFKHQSAISGSFANMAAYFRKFHANFKSKKASDRLFKGMNPTLKQGEQLVFDSNYQSGNLDAAIKVNENQYDLFMRIDTNTRGHVQWFNFTVKNIGKKKVKFNIVNFKKYKSLYARQMKPYIFSQHLKQTKELDWHQGGLNVKYQKQKLRYVFLEDMFTQDSITFNSLKFEYVFQTEWEVVHFAYCPPFTYSQLLQLISDLKKSSKTDPHSISFIKQQSLCESLGGLDVPLLTITDPEVEDKQKKCMMISGRIHPGETCGSHMMNGFLKFICSNLQPAKQLRKQIIFKVVPMLNPDGVVVGNFRTSMCGRDLNRQFRNSSDFLIPEVRGLKHLVVELKSEYKSRFIFFLDFHGHSVKKNVFLYGPEYEIWENNYYRTRIFPKLLAIRTQIFRYYSCLFRIADFKRTTARAVVLNNVPHCYTIQASTGFFYSSDEKKDIPFTPASWEFMGKTVAEGIKDYMDLMYDQEMNKLEKKQKLNQLKFNKIKSSKQKQKIASRSNNFQTRMVNVNSAQKYKGANLQQNNMNGLSQRARQIIQAIKMQDKERQVNAEEEDGHDSDKFSEGGSDSQGSDDDIPEEELNMLHEQILDSLKEFRSNFYGKGERQYSFKETRKRGSDEKKIRESVKFKAAKESKGIQMIASLRKKAEQMSKPDQIFKWPKVREQSKSLTAGLNKQVLSNLSQQKTKMNLKSYLNYVDSKQKKQLRTNSPGFLQIHGEGKQFHDINVKN